MASQPMEATYNRPAQFSSEVHWPVHLLDCRGPGFGASS